MTRQKAPWARRAGAGWGPEGERRHTLSGGKPVPARWGVRGGGEPGANGRVTQRLEFTTQVRPPGRGCPQSVRGRERESAPLQEEGAPAPSATFLFLFFGALGERAARRRKTVPGRRGNRGQQAPELLRVSPCRRAAAAVAPSSRWGGRVAVAGGRGQGDRATGWLSGTTWPGGAGPARGGRLRTALARSLTCSLCRRRATRLPPHGVGRQWPFWRLKKKFAARREQRLSFLREAPAWLARRKPRVPGHPGRVDFFGGGGGGGGMHGEGVRCRGTGVGEKPGHVFAWGSAWGCRVRGERGPVARANANLGGSPPLCGPGGREGALLGAPAARRGTERSEVCRARTEPSGEGGGGGKAGLRGPSSSQRANDGGGGGGTSLVSLPEAKAWGDGGGDGGGYGTWGGCGRAPRSPQCLLLDLTLDTPLPPPDSEARGTSRPEVLEVGRALICLYLMISGTSL